ncbi:MAG: hypothetical protein RIT24_273 [Planctomycetota bacterium]
MRMACLTNLGLTKLSSIRLACLTSLGISLGCLARLDSTQPRSSVACLTSLALLGLACLTNLGFTACPTPPPAIEIGTFNIRYANDNDGSNAWRHRRELVVSILKEGDFWGLQEALPSQVDELARALPEWKMVVRSRDKDSTTGEACPILYRADRWTLDPAASGTFWLSESPAEPGSRSWDAALPRICTFARFTPAAGGAGLTIFNVHLDHKGTQARLESAKLLAKRIAARAHADEPFILLGDFNCGPTSDPLKHLLADRSLALQDAWRVTHPDAAEQPTFNGWRERCEGERIDWILASSTLSVEHSAIDASKRDGRWPSDHAIVRARIRRRP